MAINLKNALSSVKTYLTPKTGTLATAGRNWFQAAGSLPVSVAPKFEKPASLGLKLLSNVASSGKPYLSNPTKIVTQGVPNLVKPTIQFAKDGAYKLGNIVGKIPESLKTSNSLKKETNAFVEQSRKNIDKAIKLKNSGDIEGYKRLMAVNNNSAQGVDLK
jgi:hypothetical protein